MDQDEKRILTGAAVGCALLAYPLALLWRKQAAWIQRQNMATLTGLACVYTFGTAVAIYSEVKKL